MNKQILKIKSKIFFSSENKFLTLKLNKNYLDQNLVF